MSEGTYYARKAMGKCVVCGENKADEGYTTCLVCRMDQRQYAKDHPQMRSTEYKVRHAKWLARRRDVMYAFGVCVVCGKRDAESGSHICGWCKAKAKIRKRESRQNQGIIPREILWDGKHCAICGAEELKTGFKVCEKHYEILRKNMLNARAHRKEEPNLFEKRMRAQWYDGTFRKHNPNHSKGGESE